MTLWTNVLFNCYLSDMETCYKLMPLSVWRSLGLASNGFDIEPEITAKLLRAGHRDLRGADLLRRPRPRRGQEAHVARRPGRAVDALAGARRPPRRTPREGGERVSENGARAR